MTAQQLIDLAAQFNAMAASVGDLRRTNHSPALKQLQQRLVNEASGLASTSILSTLDAMEPHYDSMLSVVRTLKEELAKQARIEQVANFADKALAIAAAFRAGNVSLVISSVAEATKLLPSARS